MEQMCSYCEKFFVVSPDEHGEIDVCPNCYQEYAPWMGGTEQEVTEAWRIFERRKLDEGVEASQCQEASKRCKRQELLRRFSSGNPARISGSRARTPEIFQ